MEHIFRFVFTTLLLVCSLLALSTGFWSIASTYFYTDRFTIESKHEVCEKPLNNRCITHYEVRRDGGLAEDYVPFIYQFDRADLLDGLTFAKPRWGFLYEINGVQKPWPYLGSRVKVSLLGLVGMSIWYFVGGFGALIWWLRGMKKQMFSGR